jgi:hypothetical protein
VARAGAIIDLDPVLQNGGLANDGGNSVCYELGTEFDLIDIKLTQSPAGNAQELRHAQLDFSTSELCPVQSAGCSNALFLIPAATHGSDRIWHFTGEGSCPTGNEDACANGHFLETSFTGPAGRERVVSMTWYFVNAADLNGDPAYQKTMPASAETKLGQIRVDLPDEVGDYTLDALNAAQTNPDLGGADIRFGFGVDVTGGDGVALTTWRANFPVGPTKITGSPLTIQMRAVGGCGPQPETGACCVGGNNCVLAQTLAQCTAQGGQYQGNNTTQCTNCPPPGNIVLQSSAPADQGSLWRTDRNIFYLTFNNSLPGLPPAGALKIERITGGTTPNCTFGADLTGQFTLTLTNVIPAVPPNTPGPANSVLQVRETATTGGPLEHRVWYRVSYTGNNWTNVSPFAREFVVQQGDADGNRFVTAVDVGAVNNAPSGVAAINSRFDIDGNGFRTAVDVGLANAGQGAGIPAKACDPPPIP